MRSVATQTLLGIEAGPQQVGETLRVRCRSARQTIERMGTLRLPLHAARRLVATHVIPQLYGLHVMTLCDELKNLEAWLKKDIWGTARRSANWNAFQALCVTATTFLPKGAQFAEVLRAWWQLGSDDRLRMQLFKLWHAGFVSIHDEFGFWSMSMNMIVSTGGDQTMWPRSVAELGLTIDIHMPRTEFTHVLRQVWRSHQYAMARKKLPHVYDIEYPW